MFNFLIKTIEELGEPKGNVWIGKIPKPSAARLKLRKVVLHYGDPWTGTNKKELSVVDDLVIFTLDDKFQLKMEVMDGPTFSVEAEFSNDAGTRTEKLPVELMLYAEVKGEPDGTK